MFDKHALKWIITHLKHIPQGLKGVPKKKKKLIFPSGFKQHFQNWLLSWFDLTAESLTVSVKYLDLHAKVIYSTPLGDVKSWIRDITSGL